MANVNKLSTESASCSHHDKHSSCGGIWSSDLTDRSQAGTLPQDHFDTVARWWTGPWQHCSVTCGDQGTRKRTVLCVRQLGPDQQIALEDWQCEDLDRPARVSACPRQEPCRPERGQWRTGPWSEVSVTPAHGLVFALSVYTILEPQGCR